MGDKPYKNIRIKEPTFDRLKALKEDYETWDGFLHRAANAIEGENNEC